MVSEHVGWYLSMLDGGSVYQGLQHSVIPQQALQICNNHTFKKDPCLFWRTKCTVLGVKVNNTKEENWLVTSSLHLS